MAFVFGLGLSGVENRLVVRQFFRFGRHRIQRRVVHIVFAERMAVPVVAQIQPPHIGVPDEMDAEEVENLAFFQQGGLPQVAHGRDFGRRPVGAHFYDERMAVAVGVKAVEHAQAVFALVQAHHITQKVERQAGIGFQKGGHGRPKVRLYAQSFHLLGRIQRLAGESGVLQVCRQVIHGSVSPNLVFRLRSAWFPYGCGLRRTSPP